MLLSSSRILLDVDDSDAAVFFKDLARVGNLNECIADVQKSSGAPNVNLQTLTSDDAAPTL
eukprot:4509986-Karenia_brevis.AAC.1